MDEPPARGYLLRQTLGSSYHGVQWNFLVDGLFLYHGLARVHTFCFSVLGFQPDLAFTVTWMDNACAFVGVPVVLSLHILVRLGTF